MAEPAPAEGRAKTRIERILHEHPRLYRLWELASNVVLMLIFGRFAWRFGVDFYETERVSSLLVLASQGLLAAFSLTRRLPSHVDFSLYAWFVAIAGTWTSQLFLEPGRSRDTLAGQIILLSGLVLQVASMLSLNRSFGIVPANRGIKTGGMYRVVRHPLYACYVYVYAGILINHYSVRNAIVIVVGIFFQILRIQSEEKFLSQDPEYRRYMQRTRWRLIPFVY
jgi:protein-S-isoprenylcysteine O-methyltransferase Ste14